MRTQVPKFGVKIECADGAGCNGLPCEIDPSKVGVGGVTSPVSATGAGGADFCVVTVPSGAAANIVVFNAGDSGASGGTPAVSKPPAAGPSASSSAPANSGAGGSATSVPLGPPSVLPGIFHENGTSPALNSAATTGAPGAASTNGPNAQASSNGTGAATTSASSSEGVSQGGGAAVAGLLVAFVAAAWMY